MFNYELVAILLLIIGLAVLTAEILIPSGGVIGILAAACLVGSFWAAWQAWWDDSPFIFAIYVCSFFVFIPVTIGGAFYILPKTAIGKKLFAEPPSQEEVMPFASETQRLRKLVGNVGKSLTMHNSGGMISLGGVRYHSESEGVLIDPGVHIRVIGVKGNSLLVREISEEEFQAAEQQLAEQKAARSETTAPKPANGSANKLTEPESRSHNEKTASTEPNVDFDIP